MVDARREKGRSRLKMGWIENLQDSVVRIRDVCGGDVLCGNVVEIKYTHHQVYRIVKEFEEGFIVLPEFQRRYVWKAEGKQIANGVHGPRAENGSRRRGPGIHDGDGDGGSARANKR